MHGNTASPAAAGRRTHLVFCAASLALLAAATLEPTSPSHAQQPTVELCPPATVGVYPNCRPVVRSRCPPGTFGVFPSCRPTVRGACPPGNVGIQPTCRPVRNAPTQMTPPRVQRPPAGIDPKIPLP
ncbi:hypothetical protein [Chelativorans alearense]|uniref:hypothetical protein n=1 Tax=Chelativorans alearense TaxID=2681495 RepID=UPI0013D6BD87|nr:hypothetical protein [Chelativorans alearense]